MGLFVDLINLSERRTNDALEFMCKASHDDDDGIWLPIDNPFLKRLVELFTDRGLLRLKAFREELQNWSDGQSYVPGARQPKPDGYMERWTPGELSLVKLYLQHLPPGEWALDDHMMLVDWLVQRYLPADDLRTEAEWLSTRASLMGRVQANMEKLTAKQADVVLAALPATVQQAGDWFSMSAAQRASMDFARVRCAENVRKLSDDARHRMRGVIAQHVEGQMLGAPGPVRALESKLLDEFGVLNRDFRRIAVTEAGEALNQGYVASVPRGTKLKRLEQYKNACAFCRKIDGRVVEVVDAGAADKDPDTQIWPGKNNIGRSASPRKRVGSILMEREPEEMWTIPAGLVHPHCRGRWLPVIADEPGDDAEFGDWLRSTLGGKNGT